MRKSCLFFLLLCILGGSLYAADVVVPATMSCRTTILSPNDCTADSSKLSIRRDSSSNKSWIRFDLGANDPLTVRAATLTLVYIEGETGTHTLDVSAVNDSCHDNDVWTDAKGAPAVPPAITWNTAPGNDIASLTNPDSTKTTLMGTISTNSVVAFTAVTIDVTSALQANTDNIVQFILHNSSTLMQIGTHDHPTVAYRPYLTLTYPPAGADIPDPEDKATVTTGLPDLSWDNPDPNDLEGHITCTVYLGTEPNRLGAMTDSKTLPASATSVAINETNFPKSNPLVNLRTYYWTVDCYDTSLGATGATIPGEWWSFQTYNNQAPTVTAVSDPNVTWLTKDPNTVTLTGTANDDGSPSGTVTTTWTETSGLGTATIVSPSQLSTVVSFSAAGDYTFTFTASDGELQTNKAVRVVVGNGPCDASHVFTGDLYNQGDANEDCVVNIEDLQLLILADWLECTDELENCGF